MTLIDAIRSADLATVASLLRDGDDPNVRSPEGLTPLMIAAGGRRAEMVELLLMAGADVLAMDPRAGSTALHKAALSGDPETAAILLDHGAFIDQQIPILGHTALMDSVIYKHPPLTRLLLDRGARTSIRNHWGESALDLARRDGLAEIAEAIDARNLRDAAEIARRSLIPAIKAGDATTVRRLIAEGADVNARLPMVGSPDDDYTPLAIAAREGHADVVEALLAAGADTLAIIGLFRGTALHEACYFGHVDVVRTMMASRDAASVGTCDLDAQGSLNGMSPLHDAVWHGHAQTCVELVRAGHRLDLRTHAGLTPRDLAARYGYREIAAGLDAAGAGEVTAS